MTMEIDRVAIASQPTAVIAAVTTWDEYPRLWRELLAEVHREVTGPGRNVMLYLDDTPRVEVGVELTDQTTLGGRVQRSALPGGTVAATIHRGDYSGLGAAHDAVHAWSVENGWRLAGPRWEVYGHWHADPAELETEIYYLLAA